jgi:hypothetical protein
MKRKRIWYVPGLFSLLGLPVILLIWGPDDPVEHHLMGIFIPSERRDAGGLKSFNRQGVMNLLRKKKITTIDLDDLPSRRSPESNVYRRSQLVLSELARLQFTHDTSEVLDVHLYEESTYGQFVWLANNATVFGYHRYVFLDDDFYYFPNPPPPRYESTDIKFDTLSPEIILIPGPPPPTKWDLFWRDVYWKW